jgi:hypothetical protein
MTWVLDFKSPHINDIKDHNNSANNFIVFNK